MKPTAKKTSRGNSRIRPHDGRVDSKTKPSGIEKPAVPRTMTFEDIQKQFITWVTDMHIPGKIQAWWTSEAHPENADWKIYNKLVNGHESLLLDAPAKGMEAPAVVVRVMEQVKKEHLRNFRKSIRTVWFRACGNGSFALVVQANLRGKNSAHEGKTFVDFLQRSCPEIISCHQIQCLPFVPFDPTVHQSTRIESRCNFGNDLIPLDESGLCMHVLDWAPRIKDAWFKLPRKIADFIHIAKGDKFFEFYSGSSFVSASLAPQFSQVEAQDCRETAMISSRQNIRNCGQDNMRFHRGFFEPGFLAKFFSKAENDGRWTIYLNLPAGEALPSGTAEAIAGARPERILLQTSELELAAKLIRQFRNQGYVLRKTLPLYLEPGTGKFEILSLFVPDRAGLLGRTPLKKGQKTEKNTPKALFVQKAPTFKQRKD